jgi:hypothetical protein
MANKNKPYPLAQNSLKCFNIVFNSFLFGIDPLRRSLHEHHPVAVTTGSGR